MLRKVYGHGSRVNCLRATVELLRCPTDGEASGTRLSHVGRLKKRSMTYVESVRRRLRWRMAIAKDELGRGERSIAEIAFLIGFQSGGAFTRAFARSVGCRPPAFVEDIALTITLSSDQVWRGRDCYSLLGRISTGMSHRRKLASLDASLSRTPSRLA